MSRIGRKPVTLPAKVKASVADGTVTVEGPKGTLTFKTNPKVTVDVEDGKEIRVSIPEEDLKIRPVRALWGTTRSIIDNMVKGVTDGYTKSLEVVGAGWAPTLQGQQLKVTVGFANPIIRDIPQGLSVTVEKSIIKIEGADKQQVGQFAAEIRACKKPEPYNGKGIKYTDEVIMRKQGKAFGS